jgi:hypothetical protein
MGHGGKAEEWNDGRLEWWSVGMEHGETKNTKARRPALLFAGKKLWVLGYSSKQTCI